MNKNLLLISIVLITALLFGCASSPSSEDAAAAAARARAAALGETPVESKDSGGTSTKAKSSGKIPDWTSNTPSDSAYYIGIGASDTGSKADDMEMAKAKALTDLAAQIRVKIQAESTIEERGDSEGNRYESAENLIKQSVDENLTLVEVADSYWSEKEGYWFYLRINIADWEEVKRREKAELERRVINLVEPKLASRSATVASRLSALAEGWDLIMASPYAGTVQSSLAGKDGILLDLIENSIGGTVNSMLIQVKPSIVPAEVGRPVSFIVAVDADGATPGQLYIDLMYKTKGTRMTQIATDQDGVFDGTIETTKIQPGKTAITARLNVDTLGIELDRLNRVFIAPERDFFIDVQQVKAGLKVAVPEGVNPADFYKRVEALLAKTLPFKIGKPSADDRFVLGFSLQFTDYPENKYGLLITEARAIITVEKDGRTLYSTETENIKAGGLNRKQAYDKSTEALMTYIGEESGIANELSEVLSYE